MARTGLQNLPDTIRVTRAVAVGDVEGYELAGDLGVSHVAWQGDRLITDQMAGCRFRPPLPLLAAGEDKAEWRGWILAGDRREPWKAEVVSQQAKLEVLKATATTTLSTVAMRSGTREMTISTWFEPHVGIVRQEQREGARLELRLDLLSE